MTDVTGDGDGGVVVPDIAVVSVVWDEGGDVTVDHSLSEPEAIGLLVIALYDLLSGTGPADEEEDAPAP